MEVLVEIWLWALRLAPLALVAGLLWDALRVDKGM